MTDRLIGLSKDELDRVLAEGTPAADSLKGAQKTKPTTTRQARALELFMKLAPEEQEKVFDDLENSIRSHQGGDGVPDGTAARNRKSRTPGGGTSGSGDLKMKKPKDSIKESFPGTSDELLEQMADAFHDAVIRTSAGDALRELFSQNPHFSLMFADDETIDAVELLCAKIESLEEGIALAAEERAMLEQELIERQATFKEETLFNTATRSRSAPPRRSLDSDFTFNGEDGKLLMGEEESPRHHDAKMQARLEHLNRMTLNS
jgi:hypothetical protein